MRKIKQMENKAKEKAQVLFAFGCRMPEIKDYLENLGYTVSKNVLKFLEVKCTHNGIDVINDSLIEIIKRDISLLERKKSHRLHQSLKAIKEAIE